MRRGWMVVAGLVAVALVGACDPPGTEESSPPLVRAGGAAPNGPPPTLTIVCTANGGTRFPAGRSVAARADGVHLHIDNRAGEEVSINGLTVDAEAGVSDVVTDDAPGRLQVACWPYSDHGSGKEPPTTAITVADPDEHWVSDELACARNGMISDTIIDYAPSGGDPTDPLLQARRKAGPELHSAEFVPAGYPESTSPTVVARRGGRAVAVFGFHRGTADGWLLGSIEACA